MKIEERNDTVPLGEEVASKYNIGEMENFLAGSMREESSTREDGCEEIVKLSELGVERCARSWLGFY